MVGCLPVLSYRSLRRSDAEQRRHFRREFGGTDTVFFLSGGLDYFRQRRMEEYYSEYRPFCTSGIFTASGHQMVPEILEDLSGGSVSHRDDRRGAADFSSWDF